MELNYYLNQLVMMAQSLEDLIAHTTNILDDPKSINVNTYATFNAVQQRVLLNILRANQALVHIEHLMGKEGAFTAVRAELTDEEAELVGNMLGGGQEAKDAGMSVGFREEETGIDQEQVVTPAIPDDPEIPPLDLEALANRIYKDSMNRG